MTRTAKGQTREHYCWKCCLVSKIFYLTLVDVSTLSWYLAVLVVSRTLPSFRLLDTLWSYLCVLAN